KALPDERAGMGFWVMATVRPLLLAVGGDSGTGKTTPTGGLNADTQRPAGPCTAGHRVSVAVRTGRRALPQHARPARWRGSHIRQGLASFTSAADQCLRYWPPSGAPSRTRQPPGAAVR